MTFIKHKRRRREAFVWAGEVKKEWGFWEEVEPELGIGKGQKEHFGQAAEYRKGT